MISSCLIAVTSLISDKATAYHTIYPVFILTSSVIFAFQLSIFFKRNTGFFLIILLLVISVDTVNQNRSYVPVNEKTYFISELDVPLINFVKKNLKKYEGVLAFEGNFNVNGTLGNYGIRELVVHEFHSRDYKDLIIDTFSEESFVTPTAPMLSTGNTDYTSSFIQLMGAKYLIFHRGFSGDNLPHYYNLVYSNLDGKVYENNLYKRNRGIFFCRPKYYKAEEEKVVKKNIKSMDYSRYVYVEDDREINLSYADKMVCSINRIDYTPNKIVYQYRANSDGILTFPEAFNEDWSVTVNGRKTDVLRTNLIFRGVVVEKGQGEIIFKFHVSKAYKILLLVGLISFLFLTSLYLFSFKLEKQNNR